MLLRNLYVRNGNPGRELAGPTNNPRWLMTSTIYNFYTQSQSTNTVSNSSFPNGRKPPYSWVLAPKGGGMSSLLNGSVSSSVGIYGAKAMTAPITASGVISNADCGLITNMIAELVGSGTLSGSAFGAAQMVANIAASGDFVGALTALGHLVADINAAATLEAENYAIAHMTADISQDTGSLTAAQVANEVWNTVASSVNNTGTTGEKLNAAGTAGDPWTADLSGYNTPGTAGKKLKDQKNSSLLVDGEIII